MPYPEKDGLRLYPSKDLMRILAAYASLHNTTVEQYATGLLADGVEAEGHSRMDLSQIPEIMSRGGPRNRVVLQGGIRPPVDPAAQNKWCNCKELASRLGLSRFMLYQIKGVNAHLAKQGTEPLLFNGRMSTPQRINDWLDRHPDWRKREVRKPEPPPGEGAFMSQAGVVDEPGSCHTIELTPQERGELLRLAESPLAASGEQFLHGGFYIAKKCKIGHMLESKLRSAGMPRRPGGWVRLNDIKRWVRANIETLAAPLQSEPQEKSPAD